MFHCSTKVYDLENILTLLHKRSQYIKQIMGSADIYGCTKQFNITKCIFEDCVSEFYLTWQPQELKQAGLKHRHYCCCVLKAALWAFVCGPDAERVAVPASAASHPPEHSAICYTPAKR